MPEELAFIGDVVHDATVWEDVFAGATEEQQVDGAGRGGGPGYAVGGAGGDYIVCVGCEDGVADVGAGGELVAGLGGGGWGACCEGEGEEGKEVGGVHCCWLGW